MADRAVFVDLDGTVLDVSERLYRIYHDALASFGVESLPRSEYWTRRRSGQSDLAIYLRTGQPRLADRFIRRRTKCLEQNRYLTLDTPVPSVEDALRELRKTGAVHLVTLRENRRNLRTQLRRFGLVPFFDRIIMAADQPEGSPWEKKASAIRKAIDRMPGEGMIIGDTQADILCGRMLGLRTIAVTSGLCNEEVLRQWQPDWILNALPDVVPLVPALFQERPTP